MAVLARGLVTALMLTAAAPVPKPPVATPGATTDTIQGGRVADPYRWLEDPADPKVKAWVAGQNATTHAYLDGLPVRGPLHDWLLATQKSTPTYDAGLRVAGGRMFALTITPGVQQPVLNRIDLTGATIARHAIVDPNTLSAKGAIAIDWWEPSPDGRKIAVSLSVGGSEDGTLHVYDVDTGREIEPPIAHVQFPTAGGSLAWGPDSNSYWYTRFPETGPDEERHFNQSAWYHVVGRPAAQDVKLLDKPQGLPRTAEIALTNELAGKQALATVEFGDGGQYQVFVLTPTGARLIASYDDRIVAAALGPKGEVYGISHKDAPNGALARLDPGAGPGQWKTIVPAASYALVGQPPLISGGRLYALAIDGGPTRLLAYDLSGKAVPVETPPVASITSLEADGRGGVYYRLTSYTTAPVTMHLAAGATAAQPTPLRVASPIRTDDVDVRRVFATSKDGTRVPITLLMKKGTRPTGGNPTLLYGYGGYGVSLTPSFLGGTRRAFLDAGGIYAIANIRGGGEYGEAWHTGGNLLKKQNVFDDFAACGDWLIAQNWTSHDRLALMGGSNGGLLMGATVTQHPTLARAVVSAVGIYDMTRVELDPNGSFNVTEFGTVKDPAQFRALYAYSPYHHVVQGARYPAMLLTTGDNDGRVNPLHSRKFVAAMQAATGSGRPIYLRTTAGAGHGMGSSLDIQISEQTDDLAFLFDQLGMTWTAPAR